MAMTRSTLVTEVCNTVNRDPASLARDGSTTFETRVKTWLNWAQVRIVRDASVIHKYDLSHMQNTSDVSFTASGASQDLPSGAKNVFNAKITTSAKSFYLIYKTPDEFDALVPDPANRTEGCPIFYTVWEKKIEVYPVPDATYTVAVRYSKYATDFSVDGSESELLNMDDVLVTCTVAVAYETLREVEDAAHWKGLYLQQLEAVIRADLATTTPSSEKQDEVVRSDKT